VVALGGVVIVPPTTPPILQRKRPRCRAQVAANVIRARQVRKMEVIAWMPTPIAPTRIGSA